MTGMEALIFGAGLCIGILLGIAITLLVLNNRPTVLKPLNLGDVGARGGRLEE